MAIGWEADTFDHMEYYAELLFAVVSRYALREVRSRGFCACLETCMLAWRRGAVLTQQATDPAPMPW